MDCNIDDINYLESLERKEEGCSIITCDNCQFVNVLELDLNGQITPEEEMSCWCCGEELL